MTDGLGDGAEGDSDVAWQAWELELRDDFRDTLTCQELFMSCGIVTRNGDNPALAKLVS